MIQIKYFFQALLDAKTCKLNQNYNSCLQAVLQRQRNVLDDDLSHRKLHYVEFMSTFKSAQRLLEEGLASISSGKLLQLNLAI